MVWLPCDEPRYSVPVFELKYLVTLVYCLIATHHEGMLLSPQSVLAHLCILNKVSDVKKNSDIGIGTTLLYRAIAKVGLEVSKCHHSGTFSTVARTSIGILRLTLLNVTRLFQFSVES